MPTIGPLEVAIVLIVLLLVFGARKLPEYGRGLGSGLREFKDSITGKESHAALPAPDDRAEPSSPANDGRDRYERVG